MCQQKVFLRDIFQKVILHDYTKHTIYTFSHFERRAKETQRKNNLMRIKLNEIPSIP